MSIDGHNFYQNFEQLIFLTFSGKNVVVLNNEISFNFMHAKKKAAKIYFFHKKSEKLTKVFKTLEKHHLDFKALALSLLKVLNSLIKKCKCM